MGRMRYEEPASIARAEAIEAFRSGDPEVICLALVRLAYHDPDWRFVQRWCLDLLDDDSSDVRGVAVACLGHTARIHGELDFEEVLPRLRALTTDRTIGGRVQAALDDIEVFTGHQAERLKSNETLPSDGGPLEYLRGYDDDLNGALALVIADVLTAGFDHRGAEDLVWQAAERRLDPSATERDVGGAVAIDVAEYLQEWIQESRRDTAWPACPLHHSHPLWLTGGSNATWTCTSSVVHVARLGGLADLR